MHVAQMANTRILRGELFVTNCARKPLLSGVTHYVTIKSPAVVEFLIKFKPYAKFYCALKVLCHITYLVAEWTRKSCKPACDR